MIGGTYILADSQQFTEVGGEYRVEAGVSIANNFQGYSVMREDVCGVYCSLATPNALIVSLQGRKMVAFEMSWSVIINMVSLP